MTLFDILPDTNVMRKSRSAARQREKRAKSVAAGDVRLATNEKRLSRGERNTVVAGLQ